MDLHLLIALNALLEEESVLGAAKRMHLSSSAMSRTLSRIREALGDPILVRAGRGLVPTPRASAMKPRVRAVIAEARALLEDKGDLNVAALTRSFVIRTSDGFAGLLGGRLLDALRAEAPNVSAQLVPEGDEDVAALREGRVDLDIGVIGPMGPEIRVQSLLKDQFVGVVRSGHPLASGKVTPKRFIEHTHIGVSRKGAMWGPIDDALKEMALARTTALVVPSFYAALFLIAESDLVGALSSKLLAHTKERLGLVTFPLPVPTPEVTVAQAWHPRFDADPAHRFVRERVRRVCESFDRTPPSSALAAQSGPRSPLRAASGRRTRRSAT